MTSQQTGGLKPTRRTLVKGAAWSVPVVAIGQTARAQEAACSPNSCPVIVTPLPGAACKHGGNSCPPFFQAYRFTFCFTNQSDTAITVSLDEFRFDDGRTATPQPASVIVPAGAENYCIYVYADDMGNSSNGQGFLDFSYTYDGELVEGSIQTGANDLPPCTTCGGTPSGGGTTPGPESVTDGSDGVDTADGEQTEPVATEGSDAEATVKERTDAEVGEPVTTTQSAPGAEDTATGGVDEDATTDGGSTKAP